MLRSWFESLTMSGNGREARRRRDSVNYRRLGRNESDRILGFLSSEGQPVEHVIDVLSTARPLAWVALDGVTLVGWILTRPMRSEDGAARGGIEDIVVARSHRSAGIGRHLVELAESHYRRKGFEGMQLTVRADNQIALRPYESLRYVTTQHRLRMWKQFVATA